MTWFCFGAYGASGEDHQRRVGPEDNPGPARTGRAGRGGQREQFGGVSLGLVVFIPTLHRPVRIRLH